MCIRDSKNTAFGSDVTHPIPPYMLNVDIYINEAPCESCFAQLNGDNPITGDDEKALNPKSNVFIPDVWLGRFPVRNEAELTAMVAKIVAYESTTAEAGWATTQLFLADNYITSINAQNQVTIDRAGDFAKYSDEVIQLFGYGAAAQRVYYDHSPDRQVDLSSTAGSLLNTTVRTAAEPWRMSSIPATNQKAISAIKAGVGLMVYNGHSNHWNYAQPEDRSGAAAGQLMSIFDVPSLVKGGKFLSLIHIWMCIRDSCRAGQQPDRRRERRRQSRRQLPRYGGGCNARWIGQPGRRSRQPATRRH